MPRPGSFAVAALLTVLAGLGPISTDLYLPSLPGIARAFSADIASVQLTLSVFLAGFACGQVIYGPLSDRFGRRPVLLGGVALYLAGGLACLAAPGIAALVGARFVQAVGAAVGPVLARAVVRDVYEPGRAASVLAYVSSAMAIAPLVGPVIGGQLEVALGWRANFAALAGYGALALLGAWAMLAETNRNPDASALHPARIIANARAMLANPRYTGCVLAMTFCYGGLFSFISGSSFVLIGVVGIGPDAYGFAFAAMVVGYMTGAFSAGRVVRRLGIDRVVTAGAVLMAVAGPVLAALAFVEGARIGVAQIVVPMVAFAAGVGWVMPAAAMGAVGPYPDKAGAASSLLGFIQNVTAALIGIGVSLAFDGTARPMAAAVALCGVASLAAFAALTRR